MKLKTNVFLLETETTFVGQKIKINHDLIEVSGNNFENK